MYHRVHRMSLAFTLESKVATEAVLFSNNYSGLNIKWGVAGTGHLLSEGISSDWLKIHIGRKS